MENENRVSRYYAKGTDDFNIECNMLLNDGVTCRGVFTAKPVAGYLGKKKRIQVAGSTQTNFLSC